MDSPMATAPSLVRGMGIEVLFLHVPNRWVVRFYRVKRFRILSTDGKEQSGRRDDRRRSTVSRNAGIASAA